MTARPEGNVRTAMVCEPRWYQATAAALVVSFGVIVAWDVHRFNWLRGYDAWANSLYAAIVAGDHRLPTRAETTEWHTPPLWHFIVGELQKLTDGSVDPVEQTGQFVAGLCGLLLVLVVFGFARELWPRRRVLHLVALGIVVFSPALVRASVMYHPETMAVLLGTLGLLCAARALRPEGRWFSWTLASTVFFGLGVLTRAWVWPIALAALLLLGADALMPTSSGGWRRVALFAAVLGAMSAPWLVHQKIVYGNAFAFNRPAVSAIGGRPLSFFLGPHALDAFDRPIPPRLRNEVVPQMYADWWGDFFLTWGVPLAPQTHPGQTSDRAVHMRSRQSMLGVLPTVLALAGIVALGLLASKRRDPRLALLPLPIVLFALAFLWFQLKHPVGDADTIKGTYALAILPGLALGGAFSTDLLARSSRLVALLLASAAIAILVLEARFLIL
jgi:hypothetical protein